MGLNIIENSDVMQFIESVEDERMKELLNRMHCEHYRYVRIGTPEQCKKYKDLCDLKPSDYIRLLDNCTKAFKEELECKEKFYKNKIAELEKKKKGIESHILYEEVFKMLKITYGNIYTKNTEIVKERLLPKDELTVALDFLNSVESEFYDENGNLPEDYYGSGIIITYEEI